MNTPSTPPTYPLSVLCHGTHGRTYLEDNIRSLGKSRDRAKDALTVMESWLRYKLTTNPQMTAEEIMASYRNASEVMTRSRGQSPNPEPYWLGLAIQLFFDVTAIRRMHKEATEQEFAEVLPDIEVLRKRKREWCDNITKQGMTPKQVVYDILFKLTGEPTRTLEYHLSAHRTSSSWESQTSRSAAAAIRVHADEHLDKYRRWKEETAKPAFSIRSGLSA